MIDMLSVGFSRNFGYWLPHLFYTKMFWNKVLNDCKESQTRRTSEYIDSNWIPCEFREKLTLVS
jgi:hypothetical protein